MNTFEDYFLKIHSKQDFCSIRFQTLEELKKIVLQNPDIFTWKREKFKSNIYAFCCMFKNVEMLEFLETCEGFNDEILHARNYKYRDSYMLASSTGNIPVLKYLENKHNWNIYTSCNFKHNSLMIAAGSNQVSVLKYLYNKNYDISLKDKFGMTAYDYAIKYYRTKAIDFFDSIMPSQDDLFEENKKLKQRLNKIKNLIKNFVER